MEIWEIKLLLELDDYINLFLISAKTNKKLTFLYLANDVVQNCKKKGPEFARSFKDVLPEAYRHTAKYAALKNKCGQLQLNTLT